MESDISKLALSDKQSSHTINSEQSIEASVVFSSATTLSVLSPSAVDYSNKEEANSYPTSDSLTKYRLHVGTQPGCYTKDDIVFKQSQLLHSSIVNVLETFLKYSNINLTFIGKDFFSLSEWGLEPYTCILLSCSYELARGLAAIVGLALRQDAIGIYTDELDDSLSHRVFTISSSCNSPISKHKALKLMKKIIKHYEYLSAQFDEYGQAIEFHDFGHEYKEQNLIEELQITINEYFEKDLFEVKESVGKSFLLEKKDYEEASKQAQLVQLSELIKLTRLHDKLYNYSTLVANN